MPPRSKKEEATTGPGEPNADVVVDEGAEPGQVETTAGPASIDPGPAEAAAEPTERQQEILDRIEDRPVTMRDVAALQGVQMAPDLSRGDEATVDEIPFVSAGMAADIAHYGHAVDPNTGRKVVQDEDSGLHRFERKDEKKK